MTLLGDSAHAMLATFGQGANMAFEDAYVLGQWLHASADDPETALLGYEAARKPRATRVQQLSRTEVHFKKLHSDWDRLRREFAPERADLGRVLHRSAHPIADADRSVLESSIENLAFAIEEIAEIYERAKLLQEELASRLAENTGRNLYVLSLLTAVLLPMTLVTGVFGMNVAHLPGANSFPLVMLLILASGGITLALLFWRRLL